MIGFSHPTVPTEVNLLNRAHYVRLPIYELIDRTTGEVITMAQVNDGYLELREPVGDRMYQDYPQFMLWDIQELHACPEHAQIIHLWPTVPLRFLGFAAVKMSRDWLGYV